MNNFDLISFLNYEFFHFDEIIDVFWIFKLIDMTFSFLILSEKICFVFWMIIADLFFYKVKVILFGWIQRHSQNFILFITCINLFHPYLKLRKYTFSNFLHNFLYLIQFFSIASKKFIVVVTVTN